jgi:hypothetical protein
MNEITIRPLLQQFMDAVGISELLPDPTSVQAAIAEIEAALMGLAFEAHEAEVRCVTFDNACRDENNFPRLNRLHHGVCDMLTLELPPELVAWMRALFARPPENEANEIQLALGGMACSPIPCPRRALARVLLFEGIRLALLMIDHLPQRLAQGQAVVHRDGPGFVGIGAEPKDVDRVAAQELAWWLEHGHQLFEDPRPLDDLLASALLELNRHVADVRDVIRLAQDHVREELASRDELERRLQRINSPDAVLIRDYASPLLDEQRLSIDRLQTQHSLLFGDAPRNTVDQRMARLKRRLEERQWPERRRPAIIDLAAEAMEGAE